MTDSPARLVSDDVPGFFFSRAVAAAPLRRLTLVSPWISLAAGRATGLAAVLRSAKENGTSIHVVTRPPRREDSWHTEAIVAAAVHGGSRVFLHPTLHAKFFVMETASGAFGVVGSANLTASGSVGREVGIAVSGQGWGVSMLNELLILAGRLGHDPGAIRWRERGNP